MHTTPSGCTHRRRHSTAQHSTQHEGLCGRHSKPPSQGACEPRSRPSSSRRHTQRPRTTLPTAVHTDCAHESSYSSTPLSASGSTSSRHSLHAPPPKHTLGPQVLWLVAETKRNARARAAQRDTRWRACRGTQAGAGNGPPRRPRSHYRRNTLALAAERAGPRNSKCCDKKRWTRSILHSNGIRHFPPPPSPPCQAKHEQRKVSHARSSD
jgi:hypothetical protein